MPEGFDVGRLWISTNVASIYRIAGDDAQRASLGLNWRAPLVGPWGQTMQVDLFSRVDGFQSTSYSRADSGKTDYRLWPGAAVEWRWPFARAYGKYQHIIEPIAQIVATPNGGNPTGITNEDSQTVDFSASNLFTLDRNNGFDRVEDGVRVNYGLFTSLIDPYGGHLDLLAGQVYRLRESNALPSNTGLNDNKSDYVLQAVIEPNKSFRLSNRARLAESNFAIRQNELEAVLSGTAGQIRLNYLRLYDIDPALGTGRREEVFLDSKANLTKEWWVGGYMRRDLTHGGRTLKSGFAVGYENECVIISIGFDRDETRDRDAAPSSSFNLRIVLKQLG